jgi:hypothetical protein
MKDCTGSFEEAEMFPHHGSQVTEIIMSFSHPIPVFSIPSMKPINFPKFKIGL